MNRPGEKSKIVTSWPTQKKNKVRSKRKKMTIIKLNLNRKNQILQQDNVVP